MISELSMSNRFLNTFFFFIVFRASFSSQEPGLNDQWHGSLPAVAASERYRRQEGHHLQHPVPALWWKWRRHWCDTVWAMWARPAVHPTAPWSDWYICGDTRFCNARQLHLPCRGHEWRLWAGCGCTPAGKCYRQHTPSWWVAELLFSSVQLSNSICLSSNPTVTLLIWLDLQLLTHFISA